MDNLIDSIEHLIAGPISVQSRQTAVKGGARRPSTKKAKVTAA